MSKICFKREFFSLWNLPLAIILETDLKKYKNHMINQGDILLAMEQNYLWSLLCLELLTVWQGGEGGNNKWLW